MNEHTIRAALADGRIRGLLFDFDYTLGESERGILACTRYALESLGLPPAPEPLMKRTIGLTLDRAFTLLTGRTDPEGTAAFARLFHEKSAEVMVASARLYPAALPLLTLCRERGLAAGVVTNKSRPRIAGILEKEGALTLVGTVVSADDAPPKPAPDGLWLAAEQLGLPVESCLFLGDSPTDEAAAHAAAMPFLAVLTGVSAREDFSPETAAVPSLAVLLDWLKGGGGR